jgi:hypothetical protein
MTHYLYLDDADPKDIKTFADALMEAAAARGLSLAIDIVPPPRDLRVDDLINRHAPNGVLVDVELDKATDDSDRPYPVTGTALAQNIRDHQNAGKLPEIPLVRLSQADVVRRYVGKDHSSLDLFDDYIDKALIKAKAAFFAETLVALSFGYQKLTDLAPISIGSFSGVLSIPERVIQNLHPALVLRLRALEQAPVHDIARFLLKSLLERDGPLIGEPTLAARLGVDRSQSEMGWPKVLAAIDSTRYRGVFSKDTEPRWWADQVIEWWGKTMEGSGALIDLSSEEKCLLLRKHIDVEELAPISADEASPGVNFWSVCIESGRPLDPMNAYAVTPDAAQREWHDIQFMCREEAFHRARDPRFDPSERDRILADRA